MRQPSPNAGHRSPPACPHLPDELWRGVAGHLSTKDWVGTSGTCKQLRQVQLEHLKINATSADGSISALLWLAKQLPGARSVVLEGWPVNSALQQEVADKICMTIQPALHLPESLSKLTVLSVRLGPSEDESLEQLGSSGEHTHMGICLAAILAKAARLGKLELACISASGVPPMANLRHLALCLLKYPMTDCISTMLHSIPCLETLQLSRFGPTHDCSEEVDAMLVVPASVQRVELINLCPESLVLESNTTVVRLVGTVYCFDEALSKWGDARNQLKGLRLHDRDDDYPNFDPMGASQLWDSVEALQIMRPPMSSVHMNLHELPDAKLGNLTSLHVRAAGLCITTPALPGLRDLRIDCGGMCISFENARVTAENLLGCEFIFTGICADDTFNVFWAALAATGKACSLQQYTSIVKRQRPENGIILEVCTQETDYYHMQYGSCGVMASSDPWEDLFSACGCEGCLGGRGLKMKWTFQGDMVCSRTCSSGVCFLHPGERMDGPRWGYCACALHH